MGSQIFHHFSKWEDYRAGFYNSSRKDAKDHAEKAVKLLSDQQELYKQASRVSKDGYISKLSKPNGKTWEEFALFICDTLPSDMSKKSIKNIKKIISLWSKRGYNNGIPDEAPTCLEKEKKVPSWRRICRSLLKNDFSMNGFGISQKDALLYKNYIAHSKNRLTNTHLF